MPWITRKLYDWVFVHFRRRRMQQFFNTLSPTPQTRVLDVGGTANTWTNESVTSESVASESTTSTSTASKSANSTSFPVTLLNILDYGKQSNPRFTPIVGDATAMPFPNRSFDIVFSNSVIEHVETWEKQQAFAHEVRRVGDYIWIQTPARSFPIEAHLWALWIQYLPKKLQHRIVQWTPRGLVQPHIVHQIVEEVRLLTHREMKELFPDCVILEEKLLGLTKSYIAVRTTRQP